MPPHRSKSTSISFVEGQQNGAGDAPPLRLLLLGRLRRFVLPVYLVSLRGFDSNRSAFYLSRQRHGAGMNQKRLHRHATAAGRARQQKIHAGQITRHRIFHCRTPPLSQSQVWSLRAVLLSPRNLPCFPSAPSGSPKSIGAYHKRKNAECLIKCRFF